MTYCLVRFAAFFETKKSRTLLTRDSDKVKVKAMNRVDVVDLVDVDFDVDLAREECSILLSFEKCFKTN